MGPANRERGRRANACGDREQGYREAGLVLVAGDWQWQWQWAALWLVAGGC